MKKCSTCSCKETKANKINNFLCSNCSIQYEIVTENKNKMTILSEFLSKYADFRSPLHKNKIIDENKKWIKANTSKNFMTTLREFNNKIKNYIYIESDESSDSSDDELSFSSNSSNESSSSDDSGFLGKSSKDYIRKIKDSYSSYSSSDDDLDCSSYGYSDYEDLDRYITWSEYYRDIY